MRIFAFAAAAAMSMTPTLAAAQSSCPANAVLRDAVCVCADGYALAESGACVSAAGASGTVVAVETGSTAGAAGAPALGAIPTGAAVVGGLVLAAGVAVGVAAAGSSDSPGPTTTPSTN